MEHKKSLMVLVIFLCFISLTSAYKLDQKIDLKFQCENNGSICSNSSSCNISIIYPDDTYMIEYSELTNQNNGFFNITINNTQNTQIGAHRWLKICCDGDYCYMDDNSFIVTYTGRDDPADFVQVFFYIMFIGILGYMLYFMSYTLLFFTQIDLDETQKMLFGFNDLFYNFSGYLILLGFWYLNIYYLGNELIIRILGILLFVTAFTNIFLPIIAFMLSVALVGFMGMIKMLRGDFDG